MKRSMKVDGGGKIRIGERIRKRREFLQLSQRHLALAVGATPQHISLIEKDMRIPSLDFLVKISTELGVSIDYLVTGKEEIPVDIITAIKADKTINAVAKQAFIVLIKQIRNSLKQTK